MTVLSGKVRVPQALQGIAGPFYRSKFGEQFKFKPVSQVGWGIHISCWYECGVSL